VFCQSSLLSVFWNFSAANDGTGIRRYRLYLDLVSTLSTLPLIILLDTVNASGAIAMMKRVGAAGASHAVFKGMMENVEIMKTSLFTMRIRFQFTSFGAHTASTT
jgi:hypothetical protein